MKSKNPVNFQGIIDRKLQKNKNKTMRCVTGVAKNYSSIQQKTKQNKKTKQTKQNTLTTIIHPKKTIERRLCLLGFVLIFLSVYNFRKNSTRFPLNVILEDHLLH